MTTIDRFEVELAAWLVDTAVPMTRDDVLPIVQRTAGLRQRPRWTFPERWFPMRANTLRRPFETPRGPVLVMLAVVLLLLVAFVAIQVGSRPTRLDARAPAANGLVAFSREGDIVTVDPDSGTERVIVGGPDVDYAPAFSWDGTRIAFIRDVGDGEQALLSVRTDGSDFRALTAEPVDILGLTWSPDDQALAFANGDLVVVDADGGGSRVLFLGVRAQHPRWRPPDGSQILFENGSGNAGLYLVGRDGSDLREVRLPDGRQVTDAVVGWTSDGTRLVTSRREPNPDGGLRMRFHVLTVGDDGTVSQDTAIGPRLVAGPSGSFLSPDDRWVIAPVPETRGGDGWRTGIVSLAGGTTVGFGPDFSGEDYTLSWSPDGTTIVVKDRQAGTTWLLDAFSGRRDVQAAWNDPGDRAPTWQRVAP